MRWWNEQLASDETPALAREPRSIARVAVLVLLFLQPLPAAAHGAVDSRVTALTYEIALEPANADLYVRRGSLLQIDGHFSEALRDFEAAAKLPDQPDELNFLRAKTLLALERPAEGKIFLDRHLAREPSHADGLVARARSLRALGDCRAAADDYSRAIAEVPNPDFYLERARCLAEAGEAYLSEALGGLDAGLARLGVIASLQRLAVDLDLQRGAVDSALVRVESLKVATRRPDLWLARRGDILLQANRRDEAEAAYREALTAIRQLSPRRRGHRDVRELEHRLESTLPRLGMADSADLPATAGKP